MIYHSLSVSLHTCSPSLNLFKHRSQCHCLSHVCMFHSPSSLVIILTKTTTTTALNTLDVGTLALNSGVKPVIQGSVCKAPMMFDCVLWVAWIQAQKTLQQQLVPRVIPQEEEPQRRPGQREEPPLAPVPQPRQKVWSSARRTLAHV